MSFLSSLYLWLLPLAALPFLIHLFYNRKYQIIEFSSIKFLKDLEVESIKRVKLIELLLLMIRTIIIILIILMISRPILKNELLSTYNSGNDVYCVAVLDNSFSMHRSDILSTPNLVYLKPLENIVSSLTLKSHLKIMSLSENLILFDGLVENFDLSSIKVPKSYRPTDLKSSLSSIAKERPESYSKEIHLITDLQDYDYSDINGESLDDWKVFIHEQSPINNNISIIDIEISNDFSSINKNLQIEVTAQNNGLINAKNALLILTIDGINVGQEQFDITSNSTKVFKFNSIVNSFGKHLIKAEIVYDQYYGDNTYSLELDIPENLNIGLFASNSEDYRFINNSLIAFKENFKNITLKYAPELIQNQNLIEENNVNIVFGYDYIERNSLEEVMLANLNSGNHIYLFPSSNEMKQTKIDFFDFIGFDYSQIKLHVYEQDSYPAIKKDNLISSELEAVFSGGKNQDLDNRFFKLFKHFTFGQNKNSNLMLNGKSIWNTLDISSGHIDIIGFSPTLLWSDFPIKASFISFIDFIAYKSKSSIKKYEVGDAISNYKIKEFITPKGKKYQLKGTEEEIILEEPGVYQLNQGPSTLILHNNNSKEELYFNRIDNALLDQKFKNLKIIKENKDAERIIKETRVGIELWKYFLYLAIFLTIIEMVVSNQLSRKK